MACGGGGAGGGGGLGAGGGVGVALKNAWITRDPVSLIVQGSDVPHGALQWENSAFALAAATRVTFSPTRPCSVQCGRHEIPAGCEVTEPGPLIEIVRIGFCRRA